MYENHRDNFRDRNQDDEHRDDLARRWRRSEERYRREAQGSQGDASRFDDDRYEATRRNRDFGYGRAYRDDDYGGRSSYGQGDDWRERRTYGQRSGGDYGRGDSQPIHWHERDRELRAGHPYQGTYGGTGDSSYFTGGQGSWAVGAPQVPSAYYSGSQHFGADYRPHGYARDGYGRDSYERGRDDERGFWDRASDEVASWFGDDEAARRREADHRGRGPKDYTRSDERIREDANDKLTEDWRVDASNVTVTVKEGEVTLNGTVTSREAKRRAEDVVDDISGVKHVQNNLRVQQASGSAYTGNLATSSTSPAEGGTLGRARSDTAAKQTDKI
ncbi:MAG: BON domain-containing protein [Sphingomonadales bacterium]|nr:BON domain-containing protein [Sphingomonadales bacterium]